MKIKGTQLKVGNRFHRSPGSPWLTVTDLTVIGDNVEVSVTNEDGKQLRPIEFYPWESVLLLPELTEDGYEYPQ